MNGSFESHLGDLKSRLWNSEKVALEYLLENGPAHGYKVFKESKLKTDKTTYTALKSLTRKRLLEKRSSEEKQRSGKPLEKYYLTVAGLSVGLSIFIDSWRKIDIVVEKWKDLLPLIFGKWNFFKRQRLGEIAESRLRSAVSYASLLKGLEEIDVKNAFVHQFYILSFILGAEDMNLAEMNKINEEGMKWFEGISQDEEIRRYVRNTLRKFREWSLEGVDFADQLLKLFES